MITIPQALVACWLQLSMPKGETWRCKSTKEFITWDCVFEGEERKEIVICEAFLPSKAVIELKNLKFAHQTLVTSGAYQCYVS